ncbi:hypothetical protein ACFQX8_08750 [Klenkia terrae]|uniref:hypothetical protein n=1 Tax=Klenkia terrae TaxID=1052259 RepID=UPI0036087DBE
MPDRDDGVGRVDGLGTDDRWHGRAHAAAGPARRARRDHDRRRGGAVRPGRRRSSADHAPAGAARELLDGQLARGVVDEDEYQRRLDALADSR